MPTTMFLPADRRIAATARRRALVYFVCGNPGIIDAYGDFLECLAEMLRSSGIRDTAYDIYGRDLPGFSDDDHEPYGEGNPPLDLDGVIEAVYADVAGQRRRDDPDAAYDVVTLAGHSVGAYIAVELFSRHGREGGSRAPRLSLGHGLLLFPTLTHLGRSSNGVSFAAVEGASSAVADRAVWAAGLALSLLPEGAVVWVLSRLWGFTARASGAVARWLKSRDGLLQTLHLGRSEMKTIREDRWDDEVWGSAVAGGDGGGAVGVPRFFMFYAKEDHWVADEARDEIVGAMTGRARIVVDEQGDLPHAFSTKESKFRLGSAAPGLETPWILQNACVFHSSGR